MPTLSPPPAAFVNSQTKGNYFIYGHKFTRNACPLYTAIFPETPVDDLDPEEMVRNVISHLKMKEGQSIKAEIVSEWLIDDHIRSLGKIPDCYFDFPYFIVYATYSTPEPSEGYTKTLMRNNILDVDEDKLEKFQKIFGLEDQKPLWYATRTWRRAYKANVLSYPFNPVILNSLMNDQGLLRLCNIQTVSKLPASLARMPDS